MSLSLRTMSELLSDTDTIFQTQEQNSLFHIDLLNIVTNTLFCFCWWPLFTGLSLLSSCGSVQDLITVLKFVDIVVNFIARVLFSLIVHNDINSVVHSQAYVSTSDYSGSYRDACINSRWTWPNSLDIDDYACHHRYAINVAVLCGHKFTQERVRYLIHSFASVTCFTITATLQYQPAIQEICLVWILVAENK